MTALTLTSPSRATDAGWLAAADIAAITRALDVPYRLVGGLAVTLLVHAHDAAGVAPARETADADLGVPFHVPAATTGCRRRCSTRGTPGRAATGSSARTTGASS